MKPPVVNLLFMIIQKLKIGKKGINRVIAVIMNCRGAKLSRNQRKIKTIEVREMIEK